jgi:hypothetical protein
MMLLAGLVLAQDRWVVVSLCTRGVVAASMFTGLIPLGVA